MEEQEEVSNEEWLANLESLSDRATEVAKTEIGKMQTALQELAEAFKDASTKFTALLEKEKEILLEDSLAQYNFTNWKDFLDMQPERLQPLTTKTTSGITSAMGIMEVEVVPSPSNAYAKQHKPGAVFQAGTPHEWYVESGTKADTEGGGGYLVTRTYIPTRSEFRWFCTCIAAKRNMYSENPYCKHMYAVQKFAQHEYVTQWVNYTTAHDVASWLIRCDQMLGLSVQDKEYIAELCAVFPQVNDSLNRLIGHGYSI